MPNQHTGPAEPLARFMAKVEFTATCWMWRGARSELGYGRFRLPDRLVQAHRFSYEALVGPIPEGMTLDHICRNPPCVWPDHLEPVAIGENTRRGLMPEILRQRAAAITHCPKGHPYDDENTYRDSRNCRQCKECNREQARDYQRRRRAALLQA